VCAGPATAGRPGRRARVDDLGKRTLTCGNTASDGAVPLQSITGRAGAAIAAWPAAALLFSYELLLWLVRASARQPEPIAPTSGHTVVLADGAGLDPARLQVPRDSMHDALDDLDAG
jgi:hypothetical protein